MKLLPFTLMRSFKDHRPDVKGKSRLILTSFAHLSSKVVKIISQLLSTIFVVFFIEYFSLGVNAQVQTGSILPEQIQSVVAAQLMSNFSDGNFYSFMLISRAELASIMVKAFRLDKRQAKVKGQELFPLVPLSQESPRRTSDNLTSEGRQHDREKMIIREVERKTLSVCI